MGLFQKSVLNKYLKGIDEKQVNEAWERFKSHFHNPAIQENIRKSKEEQHQGEFLIDLFVKVLGYTNHPLENYNLIREQKNVKDAKSADGAIIKGGKIIAVIELKGTDTTNLTNIETQAFGYKNNQPDAVYVITSNFEKLRFYIDHSAENETFNLFQLTREEFNLLWLCLAKENIFNGIPKQIKAESLIQEESVTKKLYKDYSLFRNELFESIVKKNPNFDKLTLFKKTQKLLDRFLFILFAEDRSLIPPNLMRTIINKWTDLRDEHDMYQPLYQQFNKHFSYLNTGYKGKNYEIFAYNGGLFEPDDILDNIQIDDTLLYKHTLNLSAYDFESEVSVNILGHIFEHSLSEIEEIQAELEGQLVDKSKTKRKKDGVFYTPKYITKYIVDNSIGSLCKEKKAELGIFEEEYEQERTGKQNKVKVKALQDKLEQYRNWLLEITICDPACGSGAFLNQALEFLITEHRYIDELQAKLFGDRFVFQNIENSILENNLFGVDINDESIEIAKLSLWLRTAQKGRKLTSLNNNIKCGNSLIADKTIAGDKAFDWEKEFPDVFAKGGFDVVIGNPPYVGIEDIEWETRRYYETIFKSANGRFDLYSLFVERSISIRKQKSNFGFIIPAKFLNNKQFSTTRKLISSGNDIEVVLIDDKVFEEASVNSVIIFSSPQTQSGRYKAHKISDRNLDLVSESKMEDITKDPDCVFRMEVSEEIDFLIKKIESGTLRVKNIAEVKDGIVAGTIKDVLFIDNKKDNDCYKLYFGKHLSRYFLSDTNVWVNYKPEEMMKEEVKRKNGKRAGLWMRDERIFKREKILSRFVAKEIIATYDNDEKYYEQTIHSCHITDERFKTKYVLALFNSKLFKFYYRKQNSQGGDIFPQVRISSVENLPVKIAPVEVQNELSRMVDVILDLNKLLKKEQTAFINTLMEEKHVEKITNKLNSFHEINFEEFKKELSKINVVFKLGDETNQWREYFNSVVEKINLMKHEIEVTDNQIDQLIYQLYELTPEEIEIVESQS